MDLEKIIADLRAELEQIDRAIAALERFAATKRNRRGRPPKAISDARKPPGTK